MKYFVLFNSAFCLLGGLNTLREGFVTERNNGATFEFLSDTTMLKCEMSKWTEWSSCRQLGTACRDIQTRLRHCFKGYGELSHSDPGEISTLYTCWFWNDEISFN